MRNVGRPVGGSIPVDPDEVEKLAMIGATQYEMAAWFGLSISVMESKLRQPELRARYDIGVGKGRVSLRRMQLRMVEEGNATMGIWLGKQMLGQRDKVDVEMSGPGGGPLVSVNLAALSIDELEQLRALVAKTQTKQIEGEVIEADVVEE